MQGIFQDIRYAVRVLRAHAGFTLIAIVTLALGIGATSAMFSIANTVLFEPLPYPQPERLVRIWEFDRLRDSAREGLSGPDYLDLVARQRVFDSLTAFTSFEQTLTQRGGEPERVIVSRTTHGFFDVFGRRPALGRTFSAEEDRPGGARVVVLNAGFWARRFASNPNVVGQTLTIDGQDYAVIGVFARSAADAESGDRCLDSAATRPRDQPARRAQPRRGGAPPFGRDARTRAVPT